MSLKNIFQSIGSGSLLGVFAVIRERKCVHVKSALCMHDYSVDDADDEIH